MKLIDIAGRVAYFALGAVTAVVTLLYTSAWLYAVCRPVL